MSISCCFFLQGVGIGCFVCVLGVFLFGVLVCNLIVGINGKIMLMLSLCEMCFFCCFIQVQVVNNKIVFIQGNFFVLQQGMCICVRGGSGVSLVNDL